MTGEADRKQVGVTKHAQQQLRELVERGDYFAQEQDVYRLAVAVAVAKNFKIGKIRKEEIKTKWRVADDLGDEGAGGARLDDAQGTLAQMIISMHPESAMEPYRDSQYLASIGINYLYECLFEKGMTLHETLDSVAGK